MIKIGVTTRLDDSLNYQIKEQYYNFLGKSKEIEVVELIYTDKDLDKKIKSCNGFLIPGGRDINPLLYNEVNTHSLCYPEDVDLLDKLVITYAYDNNIPLLGICRGLQAINTFLGGSLFQDIPNHQKTNHKVIFDSSFKDYIGFDNELEVNSFHHQALNKLSSKLDVIARSEDGIIEACICKDKPILGLQWHPELMMNKETDLIFKWFKERVK